MSTSFPGNFGGAAVNFGTCWGTPSGQDVSMPSYMASGNQVVAEATLRRWTTSPGQLIDDPNYGENVFDLVSADLGPRDLAIAQQKLAAEAEKDQRVLTCNVRLTLSAAGLVSLRATVTTAAGPFTLVLQVDTVTPQLLLVQP